MLEQFMKKTDFSSYEDMAKGFSVTVPERFNFAWDVVDKIARTAPAKPALVWCDEKGAEASFTFRPDGGDVHTGGHVLPVHRDPARRPGRC